MTKIKKSFYIAFTYDEYKMLFDAVEKYTCDLAGVSGCPELGGELYVEGGILDRHIALLNRLSRMASGYNEPTLKMSADGTITMPEGWREELEQNKLDAPEGCFSDPDAVSTEGNWMHLYKILNTLQRRYGKEVK